MQGKVTISIRFILMFFVILLGAVPLVLMQTIVNRSVRENTLKNTTILTQGILDQSQKYLNLLLSELDTFSSEAQHNSDLLSLLENERLSENSIGFLNQLKQSSGVTSNMIVVDTDSSRDSFLFSFSYQQGKILDLEAKETFLQSQQAVLLKENYSRSLWLGTAPVGINDAVPSIWNYRIIQTDTSSFILAVSIDRDLFLSLLTTIEESTRSEVRLITSDNAIYPFDNYFFSYSFAANALSRSKQGRFISFSDYRIIDNKNEKLLIQIYSDPVYFYNLIVLTPEESESRYLPG